MIDKETAYYNSPLGVLEILGNDEGITAINFVEEEMESVFKSEVLKNCIAQLEEYFADKRTIFNLKLNLKGTEFQLKVWEMLQKIPYGVTISYLDLAKSLGDANKIRAVGNANTKNPIPVIVPCHRVIGSKGNLVGYAGGLHRKKWLINFEAKISFSNLFDQ